MRFSLLYLLVSSAIAYEGQTEKTGIQNLRRLLEGRNTILSPITQTKSEENGNSKEKGGSKNNVKEDDSKKPLWQQVADGKYGLIQKELFARPVNRPGIVSYSENPEVKGNLVSGQFGALPVCRCHKNTSALLLFENFYKRRNSVSFLKTGKRKRKHLKIFL